MAFISTINRIFHTERETLSDYLPWRYWDEVEGCYDNFDNTIGWFWELVPMAFASESTFKNLELVLSTDLPENTTIQFILFADPRLRYHIEKLSSPKKLSGYLSNNLSKLTMEWIKRYSQFIDTHSKHGFYESIPAPVRDFRLYCAIKLPYENYDKTIELFRDKKETIRVQLINSKLFPLEGEPACLLDFTRYCLNPQKSYTDQTWKPYNPDAKINRQVINHTTEAQWLKGRTNGVLIDGTHCGVYSVGAYPEKIEFWETLFLLGDIFANDLEQIPVPFILNCTYVKTDNSSEIEKKAGYLMTQKAFGAGKDKLKRKQDDFRKALNEIQTGVAYNGFFVSMVTFCGDAEEKARSQGTIESIWKQRGVYIQEEKLMALPIFLSSLPHGLFNDKNVRKKMKRIEVAPVRTIATLMPVQADWKGSPNPAFYLTTRRGQLLGIDLFQSSTNYNFAIAAESGAGKSVFASYVILSYLRLGAIVRVYDVGRSYYPLSCLLKNDAAFLDFSPNDKICINPFTHVQDVREELKILLPMLERMAKPKSGCSDTEYNTLREAIVRAFDQYKQDTTPARVAEVLMQDKRNREAFNMGLALQNYGPEGEYRRWFDGPATYKPNSTPFQVIELGRLESDKHLRSLVLMYHIHQDFQMLYFKKGRPKGAKMLILFDEASDLFKDTTSGAAGFIQDAYRKARKAGGSIGTITQRVSDYYASDLTNAMINNSAYWFFLKQKEEELSQLKKDDRIKLSDFMLEYISSVRTEPGRYSEIFIKSGDAQGVGRLFLDPFSYAMFTTKDEEREFIDQLVDQGFSTKEALLKASETDFGRKLF